MRTEDPDTQDDLHEIRSEGSDSVLQGEEAADIQQRWDEGIAYMKYMQGIFCSPTTAISTLVSVQEPFTFLITAPVALGFQIIFTPGIYTNGISTGDTKDSFSDRFVFIGGDPIADAVSLMHPFIKEAIFQHYQCPHPEGDDWDDDYTYLLDLNEEWGKKSVPHIVPIPP